MPCSPSPRAVSLLNAYYPWMKKMLDYKKGIAHSQSIENHNLFLQAIFISSISINPIQLNYPSSYFFFYFQMKYWTKKNTQVRRITVQNLFWVCKPKRSNSSPDRSSEHALNKHKREKSLLFIAIALRIKLPIVLWARESPSLNEIYRKCDKNLIYLRYGGMFVVENE